MTDQYRVAASVDTARSDAGGMSDFYSSPITSLLVEPVDTTQLAGAPFDCFGGVLIDVVGGSELRPGQSGVDVILTFLDGAEARLVMRTGTSFYLRLGARRVVTGVVGRVVGEVRGAS